MTLWVNFHKQNHEEGRIKNEKFAISDNQGKIGATILRLFVIHSNNVKQTANISNTFICFGLNRVSNM